eukprot:scaffold142548_cov13-Tisochrysis_lutea.AAC.1
MRLLLLMKQHPCQQRFQLPHLLLIRLPLHFKPHPCLCCPALLAAAHILSLVCCGTPHRPLHTTCPRQRTCPLALPPLALPLPAPTPCALQLLLLKLTTAFPALHPRRAAARGAT